MIIKPLPTPMRNFWIIFIDLNSGNEVRLNNWASDKIIPMIKIGIKLKELRSYSIFVKMIAKTAEGYPIKHPMHNFNLPILIVWFLYVSQGG